MLSVGLISLSILLILAPNLINGNDDDFLFCVGDFTNGKLEITENHPLNPKQKLIGGKNCTYLEVTVNIEDGIDWTKMERVPLPKLKEFILYLASKDWAFDTIGRYEWKNISLFGDEPKEVVRRGIKVSLYLNNVQVGSFDPSSSIPHFNAFNPAKILNGFSGQDILLRRLIFNRSKLENLSYIPTSGVTAVSFLNVKIGDLVGIIQKFESLERLSIYDNGNVDLAEIFRKGSKNLTEIYIEKTNLSYTDVKIRGEFVKRLDLMECVLDYSFNENGWKAMPNVGGLVLDSNPGKFDLGDLSANNELNYLDITNASLTFRKPTHQFKGLNILSFSNCKFDNTFEYVDGNTFPNLTKLVFSSKSKPRPEFVNRNLAKHSDIAFFEIN